MGDLIREQEDGLVIIRPKNQKKIPLDCPVCETAFASVDDVLSFKMHGCCMDCDLMYRRPNLEKWNSGWRPNL